MPVAALPLQSAPPVSPSKKKTPLERGVHALDWRCARGPSEPTQGDVHAPHSSSVLSLQLAKFLAPGGSGQGAGAGYAMLAIDGCLPLVENNLNAAKLLETLEVSGD